MNFTFKSSRNKRAMTVHLKTCSDKRRSRYLDAKSTIMNGKPSFSRNQNKIILRPFRAAWLCNGIWIGVVKSFSMLTKMLKKLKALILNLRNQCTHVSVLGLSLVKRTNIEGYAPKITDAFCD